MAVTRMKVDYPNAPPSPLFWIHEILILKLAKQKILYLDWRHHFLVLFGPVLFGIAVYIFFIRHPTPTPPYTHTHPKKAVVVEIEISVVQSSLFHDFHKGCTIPLLLMQPLEPVGVGNSSVGRASDWKVRGNTDAGRDFSPRVSFQRRLSYNVCAAPVCNHMHRRVCMLKLHMHQHLCMLKNPKHWHGAAIVWTHENTTHTDRNG